MRVGYKMSINALFENFSLLIDTDVLAPISAHLKNTKGIDVSVIELRSVVGTKVVTPSPVYTNHMNTVTTAPTMIPRPVIPTSGFPIPNQNMNMGMGVVQPPQQLGGCKYIVNASTEKAKACGKATLQGYEYCRACLKKKGVKAELQSKGIVVPPELLESQGRGKTTAGTSGTAFNAGSAFNPGAGYPQVPSMQGVPGVSGIQFPPVAKPIPTFNTTAPTFNTGKVGLATAPVVSTNAFQLTTQQQGVSMSRLDQKLHALGIPYDQYVNVDQYLVGSNNIVYYDDSNGTAPPTKYVAILDAEKRGLRAVLDQERTFALPGSIYDPSLAPQSNTVQPMGTSSFKPNIPPNIHVAPVVPMSAFGMVNQGMPQISRPTNGISGLPIIRPPVSVPIPHHETQDSASVQSEDHDQ